MMLGLKQLLNSIEAARVGDERQRIISMMQARTYDVGVIVIRPLRREVGACWRNGGQASSRQICGHIEPNEGGGRHLIIVFRLNVALVVGEVDDDAMASAGLRPHACAASTCEPSTS
jgi:hypothetical protein